MLLASVKFVNPVQKPGSKGGDDASNVFTASIEKHDGKTRVKIHAWVLDFDAKLGLVWIHTPDMSASCFSPLANVVVAEALGVAEGLATVPDTKPEGKAK